MIIVDIIANSGQGNQMFQYLAAYAAAKETNKKLIIITTDVNDNRPFCLDKFKIDRDIIFKIVRIPRFKNKKIQIFYGRVIRKLIKIKYKHECIIEDNKCHRKYIKYNFENNKNYYMCGYFESYKYFDKYNEDIIKQFEPTYRINDKTKKFFEQIKSENSVSLHIRRGDFKSIGRTINIDYYKDQMRQMRESLENPTFYLATTDDSVIEEFKNEKDVILIDTKGENKDLNDWLCLKYCHHHIITNSTYSWWAAYLSDNKNKSISVISKEKYNSIENPNYENEYEDFYPMEWLNENK